MSQTVERVTCADGTQVAYAVSGSGPALLLVPGWLSHVQLDWSMTPQRRFFEALNPGRTLVRYDRPGCGLSGRIVREPFADYEVEVMATVLDAVGAKSADVYGFSMAAALAVRLAAERLSLVRRLVLYAGWVDGSRLVDSAAREHVLGLVGEHWGLGSRLLTDIFAPHADPEFRSAFAQLQRSAATAATARSILRTGYSLDVTEQLAQVAAPTRVIHRERDGAVPLAEGRRLAAGISGAEFVVIPGVAHIPFVGDVERLVDEIRAGLDLGRSRRRFARELTGRQLEVASLVAQGLSNRQIAARLVLTERSVESHVDRIRHRLELRSRAQLAAWYTTEAAKVQ